jgi:predicted ABC-type ATPase
MPRPFILVLAGVNGAGKSSVGGYALTQRGLTWFNPDRFARSLVRDFGHDPDAASVLAWNEGLQRLNAAVTERKNFAFETTLGGDTITETLLKASRTHDLYVWFCGLDSVERHIARVRARVNAGGHDIPETRIRERHERALKNLIKLLPCLAGLQVYDNSVEAGADAVIPDPHRVLELRRGRVTYPLRNDRAALGRTPDWAKPLVAAALFRRR